MPNFGKNRQWCAILYNENMKPDWKDQIENLVQLPFAYCVHDKGLQLEDGDHRKIHTHLILVWPAPTTFKHAAEVFDRLSAEGKRCFSTIEPVYNARRMYDYLIHDTEDCRKKRKYAFSPSERVTGNLYDIGAYSQVSMTEKNDAFDKLTDMILAYEIQNYADLILRTREQFSEEWELMRDVIRGYSGYFDRLIRGVYLKGAAEMQENMRKSHVQQRRSADAPKDQGAEKKENLQNERL